MLSLKTHENTLKMYTSKFLKQAKVNINKIFVDSKK